MNLCNKKITNVVGYCVEHRGFKTHEKNNDLDGSAPDESEVPLLLIDVINDLEFEGGAQLFRHALPAARPNPVEHR